MFLLKHPLVCVTVMHVMFLGTFTKLQRAAVSFVVPVRLPVHVE